MDELASLCGAISSIQNLGAALIGFFLKKKIQLERIAKIIMDAASGVPIPNLNSLIKLSQITMSSYNTLRSSCPMLKLPPPSQGLGALQNSVMDGYNQLISQLKSHPAQGLSALDDELNSLLGQVEGALNKALGPSMNFAKCLSGVCQAGSQLGAAATGFAQSATAAYNGLVSGDPNYASPLNATQRALMNTVQQTQAGIAALIDIPRQPEPNFPYNGTDYSTGSPGDATGNFTNFGNDATGGGPGGDAQPNTGSTTTNQGTGATADQDVVSAYQAQVLAGTVRDGNCGVAVREALQQAGAIPGSGPIGLPYAYQYTGYLSNLANTPGSGWTAYYANDMSQVPADGVTVYNATLPAGQGYTRADIPPDVRGSGYIYGHVQIGPTYNGSGAIRGNWAGSSDGGSGGVYYQYNPANATASSSSGGRPPHG